jgi:hypothetical protein
MTNVCQLGWWNSQLNGKSSNSCSKPLRYGFRPKLGIDLLKRGIDLLNMGIYPLELGRNWPTMGISWTSDIRWSNTTRSWMGTGVFVAGPPFLNPQAMDHDEAWKSRCIMWQNTWVQIIFSPKISDFIWFHSLASIFPLFSSHWNFPLETNQYHKLIHIPTSPGLPRAPTSGLSGATILPDFHGTGNDLQVSEVSVGHLSSARWQRWEMLRNVDWLIGGWALPTPMIFLSQIGSSSQLLGKIKVMFQTTNQQ